MEYPKLWTKNFIAGTIVNFLLVLNYYLLMIIMTDYTSAKYHVSSAVSGLSASIFVIGTLIARFFSAKLMEKIGEKNLLLLGGMAEIIASVMYLFDYNIAFLFINRTFHGISYGMASTSVSTMVTGFVPKERSGEGVGYFMLSITLGAAIGPFLGMFLINHGGYRYIFLTCVLTAVLCVVSVMLLKNHRIKVSKTSIKINKTRRKKSIYDIFESKALPISLVCGGIYFCYSSIISFIAPYSNEINLQTAASYFFVVYSVVKLITRPFTGRLFDRKGARITMIPAFVSFFIGMICLSQTHYGWLLLGSAAFLGFGIGVIQSGGLAVAVRSCSRERISYANSTFYICIDIGTGIGPFFLGFLVPEIGYRGMYFSMALLTVVLCFAFIAVSRNYSKRKA